MSRTFDFCETMLDWVDGRINQRMVQPLWFGGGIGASGGQGYRPFKGQLVQSAITFDTTEAASPCYPSGTSSLVDNLNRIRNWQKPATWFQIKELASGLIVYIEEGIWWPQQGHFTTWSGGNSPTFTAPTGSDPRIDTLYITSGGSLGIKEGVAAPTPAVILPASGTLPLWTIYLPPDTDNIKASITCGNYVSGDGYVERDLRPFLNLGGGESGAGSGGGGASTFVQLTDTPNSCAGHANKLVVVNAAADALTFRTRIDTKTLFVMTSETYTFEAGFRLPDTAQTQARGTFIVPTDFSHSLKIKGVIRSPYGSGYFYGYNQAFYGQCGESYCTHSAGGVISAMPVTTMHNACIGEITLDSAAVGDIVAVDLIRRADNAQDTIDQDVWIPGWVVTYTA